ncbi:MAG: inorganic phosphate transporter [Coriobacteriaceae bacterium]|nr:inorganic phosphate transporter [Coriobacteriaceae bacterium]
MTLTFGAFIGQVLANPVLIIILLLVLGVTIISGATDAANAIAVSISTRAISPNIAIAMAAVCNFVGLIVMTYITTAVAETMFNMVDFSGDTHAALLSLCAAMVAAIAWGIFCWIMGIPASKSHSLIAGITGGAIALNGLGGVVVSEWLMVVYGMVFSLVAGFLLAQIIVRIISRIFARFDRNKTYTGFRVTQICCSAFLAFMHGAQDGQKFMSIALLGIALSFGVDDISTMGFPLWLMVACSLAISLGTAVGGKRIIKHVAMDMVDLQQYQGVSADFATIITLFVATMTGMPVSTSHASTSAIMGVGSARNPHKVRWGIAGSMVGAWILTFPCCGVLGYALAQLFMLIFG